jgi:hypothetical protein
MFIDSPTSQAKNTQSIGISGSFLLMQVPPCNDAKLSTNCLFTTTLCHDVHEKLNFSDMVVTASSSPINLAVSAIATVTETNASLSKYDWRDDKSQDKLDLSCQSESKGPSQGLGNQKKDWRELSKQHALTLAAKEMLEDILDGDVKLEQVTLEGEKKSHLIFLKPVVEFCPVSEEEDNDDDDSSSLPPSADGCCVNEAVKNESPIFSACCIELPKVIDTRPTFETYINRLPENRFLGFCDRSLVKIEIREIPPELENPSNATSVFSFTSRGSSKQSEKNPFDLNSNGFSPKRKIYPQGRRPASYSKLPTAI